MTYLVTGVAGFIGQALAKRLLLDGKSVIGVDAMIPYYDLDLKRNRLKELISFSQFFYIEDDLRNVAPSLFQNHSITHVLHMAAQAGVRYSLTHPESYVTSNLVAFSVLLEACRHSKTLERMVYASTSSVYGSSTNLPFCEDHRTDQPVSFYAATKKCNEIMAESYAHLYDLPITGVRFFTVYGPYGRPDMALYRFTERMLKGEPIPVYNKGNMSRDFTYIDDIVEGTLKALHHTPTRNHPLYNLGNSKQEPLTRVIHILEKSLGCQAVLEMLPMQPGDMHDTYGSIEKASTELGYCPQIKIDDGIPRFVEWFRAYQNP